MIELLSFKSITCTIVLLLISQHEVLNNEIDCDSLLPIPSENFYRQQDVSPFQISVSPDDYYPNEGAPLNKVSVSQNPDADSRHLTGIILQARKNYVINENFIVGSFFSTGHDGTTGKTCPTKSTEVISTPNTIVHENLTQEIHLPFEVVWNTYDNWGPIVFVATFITDDSKYWSHVTSPVLNVGESTTVTCLGKHCADGTCADHWDSCPEDACPVTGEYRCYGGECIASSKRCNGIIDCPGGEDEACCDDFQCIADRKCISLSRVCDIFHDCLTSDDEQDCSTRPCLESEFHCGADDCIPMQRVCDGSVDCLYGIDEKEEHCTTPTYPPTTVTAAPAMNASTMAGYIVGMLLLVGLFFAVIFCVVRYRPKMLQKRTNNTAQALQNTSNAVSAAHTTGLSAGVYPTTTNTVTSSQPYLAGIGAGYLNQGFETSHGQSESFPVTVHHYHNELGTSNMGFMEDKPPSYEQAISSPHNRNASENRLEDMITPPKYSRVPSTSMINGSEQLENHQNAAYEKALEQSKKKKKWSQYEDNDANPIAGPSISTSCHHETEI